MTSDYMLSFLFLRYLSDNYEAAAPKELGPDYPNLGADDNRTPLAVWRAQNADDIGAFEAQMRRKMHYVIHPNYLWSHIADMARTQSDGPLATLEKGFSYIENESFGSNFDGLFSEINLNSEKLGKTADLRNKKLQTILSRIAVGLDEFSTDTDILSDTYEYLIASLPPAPARRRASFTRRKWYPPCCRASWC